MPSGNALRDLSDIFYRTMVLCYSNLVPKAGLQLSIISIACGLFLNIPTILPTINEYQIVFLAVKTPLSNTRPPPWDKTP